MSARIYLEGGGEGKDLRSRCREGFRKLLEACGFVGRLPRLVACGGRGAAFDDFCTALRNAGAGDFIVLLVDSEEPVDDIEQPWAHLRQRDGWMQPRGARDDQVLLLVTCLETWIVADRAALREHFGAALQENSLPPLHELEARDRHVIQDALSHATHECGNRYEKGKRSFEVLAQLEPAVLEQHLPSFARLRRVLAARL